MIKIYGIIITKDRKAIAFNFLDAVGNIVNKRLIIIKSATGRNELSALIHTNYKIVLLLIF